MAIISHSLLKYFEIELKTLTAMVSLGNISTPATIFPTRYAAAAGSRKHQCRASIAARDELLGLISDDERGLRSQKDKRRKDRILRAFEALAAESVSSDGITTDSRLSGTWRMLWTTEKEQLFIVDKAPLFGTRAGDILQVIDVGENRLNNVITFPPSGAFVVASTMEVVSDKRVEFQFTGALLRSDTWSLPVPPFGKGCSNPYIWASIFGWPRIFEETFSWLRGRHMIG
ncbi:probable plastid-lipid-associated protein 11, chloroplastic isoform X2 [Selaginella moellendorffii]|uniref:probable plastid-lipid-associated protein 11, chloroplastic isoform X2 n=1 Tax=Selaginella moellendorffii TaxID=88036 RepID=UPI000D1C69C6|nr:probable plastid-lipid-associated protein 11, chloroplastic isoform X2 [Selaginella moellendorffii]|eukprot:XP_024532409.1 probable plastid-lipid-associated protein 11, chloroplastic isoform X2 [Selaginella moellendorffii]